MAPQLPQPVQSFWLPETKAAARVILPEHIIASLHSSLSKRNTAPSIPFPIEVALDDQQQHPRQPQSPRRMVLAKRDDICSYDPVGGSYTCDWGWYCSGPRSCTRSSWYRNRWWFFAAGVFFLIFLILLWRRILSRRRNAAAAATTTTQTTYITPASGYDTAASPYPPPPGPVPPSSQLYGAHPGTPMQTFEYRPDPAVNTTTTNIAMVPMAGLPQGQKPYDDELYSHYPPKDNLYPPANHSGYQAAAASSSSSPAPPPEYTPSSNTPYPPGSSVPPKS